MALLREHDGFSFTRIEVPLQRLDACPILRACHQNPFRDGALNRWGKVAHGLAKLVTYRERHEDFRIELLEQIHAADASEVENRRGVRDDDQRGSSPFNVSRSSRNSSTP